MTVGSTCVTVTGASSAAATNYLVNVKYVSAVIATVTNMA